MNVYDQIHTDAGKIAETVRQLADLLGVPLVELYSKLCPTDAEAAHAALTILARVSGIPRDDLKALLLMRQYRASLPTICQQLTGRREMRVLRVETQGDASVGIPGDEAILVIGEEWLESDNRKEIQETFIDFCEQYMDGPTTAIWDDQCSECGKPLLGDSGVCSDEHCISNQGE